MDGANGAGILHATCPFVPVVAFTESRSQMAKHEPVAHHIERLAFPMRRGRDPARPKLNRHAHLNH